ncbi:carboxymuconolactone decarboxylase family protein [Amycolatopsis nigrescens]|uniref:carboxymuconolactone decarboxylase family protein n=1 Tax=Amycolatopsis nigrescens TaxID=381445 RepID=UPI0003603FA1|nr:carboxymuconolactone decarboxylase family protein [Amycolatopsis nigrescens]
MTPTPVRLALRRSLRDIRYVRAVPPRRATGTVGAVYTQLERDFGLLAPPVALHSPAPAVLAASWLMLRESLVASGVTSRADKEVVASAVSRANTCPYCVEVHGMALAALGRPGDAGAISGGRFAGIEDPATRELASWARDGTAMTTEEAAIPELVAVAVVFHYLNRMVNVFLGPSPLPAAVPGSARATVRGVLGRFLMPPGTATPGESLTLLPAAPVPGDLAWARGSETVAGAFARACAAVDGAATGVVSPAVRELVLGELACWDGRPPGLSRAWLEAAVTPLVAADRPVARLALLTAFSSSQVDSALVAEFRRRRPDDRGLVELTGWASLAAARTFGAKLAAAAHSGAAGDPAR